MSYTQEEKYAFAIGAIEKLAEYEVDAEDFIKVARASDSYSMRKVADLIEDVHSAYAQEKRAADGASKIRQLISQAQTS